MKYKLLKFLVVPGGEIYDMVLNSKESINEKRY